MAKHAESVIIRNRTFPVTETRKQKTDRTAKSAKAEKPLLKAKPSWWNYFWYLFFSWLIVPLIIALWKRAGTVFYVYPERVVLERGVLSKHISQVLISDIRSIDTKYSFIERMVRVGDIWIGTAGMSGYEIVAEGMPNPKGVANLILKQRQGLPKTTD
ncbi:MAG TPA: PH domain-containing protein [Dehalococcoidia bacterium]|jgi:uncharacterized membrane protein YdbT with pleckstrin-like domain